LNVIDAEGRDLGALLFGELPSHDERARRGFTHEAVSVPAGCREAASPPSDVIFTARCFDEVNLPTWNTAANPIAVVRPRSASRWLWDVLCASLASL
jgi:hypothetical protein